MDVRISIENVHIAQGNCTSSGNCAAAIGGFVFAKSVAGGQRSVTRRNERPCFITTRTTGGNWAAYDQSFVRARTFGMTLRSCSCIFGLLVRFRLGCGGESVKGFHSQGDWPPTVAIAGHTIESETTAAGCWSTAHLFSTTVASLLFSAISFYLFVVVR